MYDNEIKKIERSIAAFRSWGSVNIVLRKIDNKWKNGDIKKISDSFMDEINFAQLGDSWKEISYENALKVASHFLCYDFAYSTIEGPIDTAITIIEDFNKLFKNQVKYLINGNLDEYLFSNEKFKPIPPSLTGNLFEAMLLVLDDDTIGLLHVAEND